MHEVNTILQISTATLLAFAVVLMFRYARRGMHMWAGIGFTVSVFCYLIIDTPDVQNSVILRPLVLTGALCIPVFLWLLSKSIFDDHFMFRPTVFAWLLLQTAPHFHHYGRIELSPEIDLGLEIVIRLVSLGFVFAAIYLAVKTRQNDLIESRRRFRSIFILLTAVLVGVTLIVEATSLATESRDLLQVLQRSAILSLTGLFLLRNFALQPGFFFREVSMPKDEAPVDPVLENKLVSLMEQKKFYRSEGLTIKHLADTMQVQEYRLRRLINSQLGFRNFNDFVNQYRVHEACEILTDPAQDQKTILEIAYSLGYQSIGPFNKAFRELTNTTPTAFRKARKL